MTITTIHTADELYHMPDDGMRHELVQGELRTMPPAGRRHGLVEITLLRYLLNFVTPGDLGVITPGDTGYLISRNPDTVLAPDAAFIAKARAAMAPAKSTYWPLAPDLAAEVLSPDDSAVDVDEKIQEWLDAGVRLLWIINPKRKTVTVYAPHSETLILREADMLTGCQVLPGFELPVKNLFV